MHTVNWNTYEICPLLFHIVFVFSFFWYRYSFSSIRFSFFCCCILLFDHFCVIFWYRNPMEIDIFHCETCIDRKFGFSYFFLDSQLISPYLYLWSVGCCSFCSDVSVFSFILSFFLSYVCWMNFGFSFYFFLLFQYQIAYERWSS